VIRSQKHSIEVGESDKLLSFGGLHVREKDNSCVMFDVLKMAWEGGRDEDGLLNFL
jgi:hypothetical protein